MKKRTHSTTFVNFLYIHTHMTGQECRKCTHMGKGGYRECTQQGESRKCITMAGWVWEVHTTMAG